MPQIAQQDYKEIRAKAGRIISIDAAALAEIKKSFLNGTIFDCILMDYDGSWDFQRVLSAWEDGVIYFDLLNAEISTIELPYTPTQYQGLAAVQNAIDEKVEPMVEIPQLSYEDEYLMEIGGDFICVDGKYLIITTDSGNILKTLIIAETGPTPGIGFVNITWEDAQKLIGLPVSA